MARIHTGNPNGRPPIPVQGREHIDILMKKVPVEVIEKIDGLRVGNESRKDVIVRLVRGAQNAENLL